MAKVWFKSKMCIKNQNIYKLAYKLKWYELTVKT